MVPGHPAGSWRYEADPARKAPTRAELRDIFDEQEALSELSADSWVSRRRLAEGIDGEPIQYGPMVCRPNSDEFNPEMLEGEISESRIGALATGEAEPSDEEIARWQAIHMERAHLDEASGLYSTLAWLITDDQNRERVLVTLHLDRGSFERVAGLFHSVEEAAGFLQAYGDFEWVW